MKKAVKIYSLETKSSTLHEDPAHSNGRDVCKSIKHWLSLREEAEQRLQCHAPCFGLCPRNWNNNFTIYHCENEQWSFTENEATFALRFRLIFHGYPVCIHLTSWAVKFCSTLSRYHPIVQFFALIWRNAKIFIILLERPWEEEQQSDINKKGTNKIWFCKKSIT